MKKNLNEIALKYVDEGVDYPVLYISPDGEIVWCNQVAIKAGFKPGSPAGEYFDSEELSKILKGELNYTSPRHLRIRDDLVPYFESFPISNSPETDGILLRCRIWRFLKFFDKIDMGMLICNHDGEIMLHNLTASQMLGSLLEKHTNVFDILADVIKDKNNMEKLFQSIKENQSAKLITNFPTNGQTKTFEFYVIYAPDEEPDRGKYYVKIIDLTDIKEPSQRRIHLLKQEFLERFSSNVFHKLNNQFLLIMADAGLIRRKIPTHLRAELETYIDRLEEHIADTSETVDLLSLFVHTPRQSTRETNLIEYLEKYVNEWFDQPIENVEIVVELPDISAPVNAYTSLLDKMFDAVLDNAVRAISESGKPGKISISAQVIHPDEFFLANYPELASVPHIKVTIADTGTGIKKEYMSRIFEPFFSGWEIPSRGLGLSTALSAIRHHGGTIDIQSKEGIGTTVSLFLPLARETERFSGGESEPPSFKGKTILVVEDDEVVQSALLNMLEALECDVIVATNIAEGVDLFGKVRPDAVILDMILPDGGGEIAYKKIMEIDPGARVIVATAYAQIETVEDLIENGVRYILQKPFTMEQLTGVLEKLFFRGA